MAKKWQKMSILGILYKNVTVVFDKKKQVWYTKKNILRILLTFLYRSRNDEVDKVDKYEYNLKLEEIDKLVDQGDYQEAANLADTIDWKRVRNIRTLCLISEIYEAAGRLSDSKTLLQRAYRRSPVGRTVLYRLVEVTTALGQYDEAIEYYSEYVQAAPHDNNRYILKYKIYKGRGSQPEELIAILEEYLGQEYTERWAYELATLYQQTGQMQKCLAACDDLVLWFHSGKYVRKALELKMRYAALTPKQQQIYEDEMREAAAAEAEEAAEEEVQEESVLRDVPNTDGEVIAESIIAQTEKEIADSVTAHKAQLDEAGELPAEEPKEIEKTKLIDPVVKRPAEQYDEPQTQAHEEAQAQTGSAAADDPEELQVELAKSMRRIISGVVKREHEAEEDIPASVDARLPKYQKLQMPEVKEQAAGQLSIDDILLSMSDQGKRVTDAVLGAADEPEDSDTSAQGAADAAKTETDKQTDPKELDIQEIAVDNAAPVRSVTEAAAQELSDVQREALQYTSNPEKLLRNTRSLPTYTEAHGDDLGSTRRISSREELAEAARQELLSEKTIRIPQEKIEEHLAGAKAQQVHEAEAFDDAQEAEAEGYFDEDAACEAYEGEAADGGYGPEDAGADGCDEAEYEDGAYDEAGFPEADGEEDLYEEEEYLTLPEHLRDLFAGFTDVEGLEDQIANAIIQAEAKGSDRTSRSGNILIFGAHGSGKTTIAMNIAKAVAQDKGSQVMKMAKIYAADLNRKDIASTIAKIAGGTLIIEEAGDLEPGTVEQLTTAMEFRTDGLIIILEDEQKYIHELLMRHPRFTMKFTAQIYIPDYTLGELANFGQIYANTQDYVIGDEAWEVFCQKLQEAMEAEESFSISGVTELVRKAIARSNKFFRKISMGRKRYDENDYVVLFPKDFK